VSGCGGPGEVYAFASPAEAVGAMLARVRAVGLERAGLDDAAGRVLGAPMVADRDSPAVDVSAMDGYAVRAADVGAGALRVAGEVRIGKEPAALSPGTAMRIVTGGAVPAGADAVVKREDVGERADRIEIGEGARAALQAGMHVRRRGENIRAGSEVVEAGAVIGPAIAAALATFGIVSPSVYRRVRVGLLTSGDEVRAPDQRPSPWELRDSHGSALRALLKARAWAELTEQRRVRDEPGALREAAVGLLREADMLLLTGGVSMGPRDFIPAVLQELGAAVIFHRVPQRPGKPILGAVLPDGRPVLGLPGNPLSVMVTARRFAVPVLEKLAGLREGTRPWLVRLEGAGNRAIDLWWHRLARVASAGVVEAVEGMGSGDVPAAARSDGFCEVPPGESGPGPWPFYPWS